MKNKIIIPLGFLILIGALLYSYDRVESFTPADGNIEIVAIQTKDDADATLIYQNGAALLIDTGEVVDGQHILQVLQKNGVTRLDCLILSHYDKDHIGGAAVIAGGMEIDRVLMPYYTAGEEIEELKSLLEEKEIPIQYPTHTMRFLVGDMTVTLYPPLESYYKKENNYSMAALISFQDVDMFFPGDALRKRSEELMRNHYPSIELYKAPHHGRSNSASVSLLEYISPEMMIVNALQLDQDLAEAVEKKEIQTVYTRIEDYYFESDGEKLWLRKQK